MFASRCSFQAMLGAATSREKLALWPLISANQVQYSGHAECLGCIGIEALTN
jgi:hypothetical protein